MAPDPASRNDPPGLLTVFSGPSGVGKTTIVREVRERLDGVFSISATTRPRTDQEREGQDYFFVTEAAFQEMIDRGELLEHAQVFGAHRYGTPRRPVEEALAAGKLVILEIDVQGALQVRASAPDAYMVFVLPPSEQSLLDRLRGRGRDDEEAIRRRFEEAQKEIALARRSSAYDAFVVNDDLARAQDEACRLVRHRQAANCRPA